MNRWKDYVERYDTVLAFLGLELSAFVAFGLGGTSGILIFRVIGFFIAMAMIPFIRNNHSDSEVRGYLIGLLPLLVLAVFLGFSGFWLTAYSSMLSGIVSDITIVLGVIGFFIIGYGLKNIKALKFDLILLTIGGSLVLLTLITTIYTLIHYGFFYVQNFSGMFYYWDGVVFPVSEETKVLFGWSFVESSLSYASLSPFLLASALPAAIYISPKKDPKHFFIVLIFGLIGLLALLILPYKKGLIILVPVYLFALIYRFIKVKKEAPRWLRITAFVLMCVISLGILSLFIDSFLANSILARIPLLGRYFAPATFFGRIRTAIQATFFKTNGSFDFVSFLFGNSVVTDANGYISVKGFGVAELMTHSLEYNILWQNGFLAFGALVVFIFMVFVWSRNFLAKGEGSLFERLIPVLMLLGALLYLSVADDELPFVHISDLAPGSRSTQLCLVFLLAGLVYFPSSTSSSPVPATVKSEPAPKTNSFEEVPLDENK